MHGPYTERELARIKNNVSPRDEERRCKGFDESDDSITSQADKFTGMSMDSASLFGRIRGGLLTPRSLKIYGITIETLSKIHSRFLEKFM